MPNERIDPPSQPTENLSALSNCYSRAGYSVLVSNGSLCESTPEMGLVEVENGAAFHIKVQNNNYYGELLYKWAVKQLAFTHIVLLYQSTLFSVKSYSREQVCTIKSFFFLG